jgi:serine/threonine-protein kinase
LVWVDRAGREDLVFERRAQFGAARLSPDGRRIAVERVQEGRSGIWILGLEDNSFVPLNNEGTSAGPLWTPDSQTVLFNFGDRITTTGSRLGGIFSRDANFRSERQEVLQTDGGTYPISWSGDGEDLVLHEMIEGVQGRRRILVVPFLGEDRTPFAPLDPSGQFNQRSPMVSPDGRWVAYMSTQSGDNEVYVRPFPDGGTRVQISNNGGVEPMWGADSSELFYREMVGGLVSRMVSVQLTADPEMRVSGRTELFSATYYFMPNWARTVYDYDRANDRFLMVDWSGQAGDETNSLNITVILNWFEELKERVPTGR